MSEGATETVTITAEEAGQRLDRVLALRIPALSRSRLKMLILASQVTIAARTILDPGYRVNAGETVTVTVPAPEPATPEGEPIPLAIVYEDDALIVLDKPSGLVVHPAAGHAAGTLVNALIAHCGDSLSGIGGVKRPGIVHRLDKDTSGVMIATKSDRAHASLMAQFQAKSRGDADGKIERAYLAIAAPPPTGAGGTLRTLYGRHPVHRKRFSSKVASGKAAVTHWERVESLAGAALVRLRLETGRTHQIRVHAADHGWPLLGDPVYGHRQRDERLAAAAAELGRQALHAAVLAFDHPVTGERLSFEAPLPADLVRVLAALR